MKKAFNIVANVCAIVLMSILALGAILLLFGLSSILSISDSTYVGTTVMVISISLLLFSIAAIVVSSLALANCSDGKYIGLQIAVIVMVATVMILEFIGNGIFFGILCAIPIGFEIATICIKPTKESAKTLTNASGGINNTAQSATEKIEELKHLKDLRVIDDDQYNEAVTAIITELKIK